MSFWFYKRLRYIPQLLHWAPDSPAPTISSKFNSTDLVSIYSQWNHGIQKEVPERCYVWMTSKRRLMFTTFWRQLPELSVYTRTDKWNLFVLNAFFYFPQPQLMASLVFLCLNHKLLDQSKREVYIVHSIVYVYSVDLTWHPTIRDRPPRPREWVGVPNNKLMNHLNCSLRGRWKGEFKHARPWLVFPSLSPSERLPCRLFELDLNSTTLFPDFNEILNCI